MKIAVVGTGGIGKTHLSNLQAMKEAEIVSICDVNAEAETLAKELGAAYDTDYKVMLAHTAADVVLICTPTFLHGEQVRATLEAGKHCICEKPLCLSAEEAKALFALAKQRGLLLLVAHVLHFWEEYAALAQMVKENRYGAVLDASFARLTERPAWTSTGWLFDKSKSGLIPFDLHIHDLYYVIGLLGKPHIGYVQSGGQAEENHQDYLRVCYEYPRTTVCVEASWYRAPIPFAQRFRVYFERAVAEYDGNQLMLYEAGQPVRNFSEGINKEGIHTSINVAPTMAYLRELEHFFDCIRQGKPSWIVPEEQVLAALETLESLGKPMDLAAE